MDKNSLNGKSEKTLCKICASESRELTSPKAVELYHACPFCGYIFMDEACLMSPEDEKKRYMKHNNTYDDQGYRAFLEGFLEAAVFPFGKDFERALDFGSGPEPVLARIMSEKHGIETDIYDLHFSPEKVHLKRKYDLVVSTEVLEHLKEPLPVLTEIAGRLEAGGLLAVMTLFHPEDDKAFFEWHYRRDKTHIGFFTAKALEIAGKTAGLELIHTDGKRIAAFKKRRGCP